MARSGNPAKSRDINMVALASGKAIEMLKGYTLGKRITVSVKLINDGEKYFFRPEGEIRGGEPSDKREGFEKDMTVVPVIDLETGESVTLICNSVLENAIRRVNGGYIGKDLLAVNIGKRKGKRYYDFEVYELAKG